MYSSEQAWFFVGGGIGGVYIVTHSWVRAIAIGIMFTVVVLTLNLVKWLIVKLREGYNSYSRKI